MNWVPRVASGDASPLVKENLIHIFKNFVFAAMWSRENPCFPSFRIYGIREALFRAYFKLAVADLVLSHD